jgi:hypothetical protein
MLGAVQRLGSSVLRRGGVGIRPGAATEVGLAPALPHSQNVPRKDLEAVL